jgi:hypothetical protein
MASGGVGALVLAAVERAARLISKTAPKETTMKTILSALIALSFIAGIAAPSSATPSNVNAKKFFDKLDKEGRGGQSN